MLMLVLNFNGRHLIAITVSLLGNRDRDRVSVNDHLCDHLKKQLLSLLHKKIDDF
jgi:hypothetical protein